MGELAMEINGADSTVKAKYYHGLTPIGMWGEDEQLYYTTSYNGTVDKVTNLSGKVVADYTYDAFGNQQSTSGSFYNPIRYCGEYYDSESGLIYLRNRYYDSSTGTFINEDPIQDGLNWYVYCEGNPVAFVDPWGLDVYYFVNTEYKKEAKKDKKKLEKYYNEPVHILEVDSRDSFINEWNKMGSWNGEDVSISLVVINMHADPDKILPHRDGDTSFIGKNDIEDGTLIPKYIDNILMLGCNSGHFDHRYSSFANKLLIYNIVDSVIASDGLVGDRTLTGKYESKAEYFFTKYLWSGKRYRDNFGFIKYTKNENGELEWDILGKKFNITSILEEAEIKNVTK